MIAPDLRPKAEWKSSHLGPPFNLEERKSSSPPFLRSVAFRAVGDIRMHRTAHGAQLTVTGKRKGRNPAERPLHEISPDTPLLALLTSMLKHQKSYFFPRLFNARRVTSNRSRRTHGRGNAHLDSRRGELGFRTYSRGRNKLPRPLISVFI